MFIACLHLPHKYLTIKSYYSMSIVVKQLTYIHPDKEVLFRDISFSIEQGQKIALTGNNGSGKSTLFQMIRGSLPTSSGEIICSSIPYYVPQHFGQYDRLTIAQALQIANKLEALYAILQGDSSIENFTILNDDWTIEEKALEALGNWGLKQVSLHQPLMTLSGGEKTRIFLAGINIHHPEIILFDEPTNHLDLPCREQLYDFIRTFSATMLVISHDRTLLNLLPSIYELSKNGIENYGGNYEFYSMRKELETNALCNRLEEKEKELRLTRKIAREVIERRQKQDSRGKNNNIKKGVGKMAMNTFRDQAEKSISKLENTHAEKLGSITEVISNIRTALPDTKHMKIDFNASSLHTGKILISGKNINFSYNSTPVWKKALNFQIKSGDRIHIKGSNGCGKSTLLKLLTGILKSSEGILIAIDFKYVYLDQEYSIINNNLSVFEQIQQFNSGLQEHELKTILNRFLFPHETWKKSCKLLSGGEKMRLALCCLMVNASTPDLFILDEPTNNIDIQNIEILTKTIKDYKGTVLAVSHDEYFIREINIDYVFDLSD